MGAVYIILSIHLRLLTAIIVLHTVMQYNHGFKWQIHQGRGRIGGVG